jgi:hypothetical protein
MRRFDKDTSYAPHAMVVHDGAPILVVLAAAAAHASPMHFAGVSAGTHPAYGIKSIVHPELSMRLEAADAINPSSELNGAHMDEITVQLRVA